MSADKLRYYLEEILELQRRHTRIICDTCDGKGETSVVIALGSPVSCGSLDEAERMESETCEDCEGTGYEWGTAS